MPRAITTVLFFLISAGLGVLNAAQIDYTQTIYSTPQPLNWQQFLSGLPQFDPSLGTLNWLKIDLSAEVYGTLRVTNNTGSPIAFSGAGLSVPITITELPSTVLLTFPGILQFH